MGAHGLLGRLEQLDDGRVGPKGKLTEAARARAFALLGRSDPTRPVAVDEQSVADFAELGVTITPHLVVEEDVFEIWDINANVFEAFLALETQWRMTGLVGLAGSVMRRTGLDYAAVDVILRRMGLVDVSSFDDIRAMEQATLDAFAEVSR